jgi:hypothetical protein
VHAEEAVRYQVLASESDDVAIFELFDSSAFLPYNGFINILQQGEMP